MSRYIDADALKINMRGAFIDHIEEFRAITIIDDAPSIDIVFCEDCLKHNVVPFGENACFYWCELRGHAVNPDDFCSWREREGE